MDKQGYEDFRRKYCLSCDIKVNGGGCSQTEDDIDDCIANMSGLYNPMDDGACC